MTKKLLLSLLSGLMLWNASACDICGCNMSGLYFGFLPMYKSHYAGVRYTHARFNAFIDNDGYYFQDESSNDTYRRLELIGRFSLSKKWQVRYIVPYAMNDMNGSHHTVSSSGFSDPVIMGYFNAFNTGENFTSAIMHSLQLGGGVKLPVGAYEATSDGDLINPNFQLGSGSTDYLMGLNYTLRHKKLGLNIESSYKLNTANSNGYQMGNQTNTSANLFYYLEAASFSILPFVGGHYERGAYHMQDDIIQGNTGGSAWLGTIGAQLYRKRLTINAQYQTPLVQSYNTDSNASIEGAKRFSVALIQSFSLGKN